MARVEAKSTLDGGGVRANYAGELALVMRQNEGSARTQGVVGGRVQADQPCAGGAGRPMGRPPGGMHASCARVRAAGTHMAFVAAEKLEAAREAAAGEACSSRRAVAAAAAARSSARGARSGRGERRRAIC